MVEISSFPPPLRDFLQGYAWRRIDPVPCAPPLSKPIRACRVALVTTGGIVPPGGQPYDQQVKGGDHSYRVLPRDVVVSDCTEHHRSPTFDHEGINEDKNLAFPLDRLRELHAAGEVGEIAPRHLSFAGSITAPGRLVSRTAPEAVELLLQDGVDLALLVPV